MKTYLTSGDHDDDAALQDFARIDGAAAATAASAEEEELRAEGGHASLATKEEVALPATLHVANTHSRYDMNVDGKLTVTWGLLVHHGSNLGEPNLG